MEKLQLLLLLFCLINMWAFILTAPNYSRQELDENYDTVNPEEEGNYFEGDILLSENKQEIFDTLRNGMIAEKYRWPDGVVPFEIVGEFSNYELALLNRALEEYHEETCIKFVPHTTEEDYIAINNNATGCYSNVGRRTGRQQLNLSSRCFSQYGIILHELMHSLGFLHEQNRHERDQYVRVMFSKIQMGKMKNFKKTASSVQTGYGVEYDYGSVMHYSPKAFSNNGQPTLIALNLDNPDAEKMGQRIGFSNGDLIKLNTMYNCNSFESSSIEEY